MPTIWEDEYLQDHTKTQLNKLLDSYDNAEWQCPRCDEVNPVWSRDRVIRGWDDFGTHYGVNKYCYECNYIRPNGKAHNLNGKQPKKKRLTGDYTEKQDLVYRPSKNELGKWYTIELFERHKTVLVYWGKETGRDTSGAFKEFNFDSKAEAREFYEKKLTEKLNKGYYDLFNPPKKARKKSVKKSTRSPKTKATTKKSKTAPKATRSKKKRSVKA